MPSNATAIDPSQVQWDAPAAETIDASKVQWDAPAANQQTAGGAAQAAASGLNAGSADLLGLPVDTARNILELGKAGLGFAYHETTGNQIPDILQPSTTPDVGSSAWIKQKLQSMEGGTGATEATEDTTANRVIHGAAEAVPSSVVGGQANTVPTVARAVTAGAAAGAAQQSAAEAGGSTGMQATVGLLAGGLTHRAIEAPTAVAPSPSAAPTIEPTKFATPEPLSASASPRAAPFTDLEGAPPRLQINGQSTAADAARVTGTSAEPIATPAADAVDWDPITSPEVQSARQQTLENIGLKEARESAIAGDTKATGTDFQTSKLDNAAGDRLSKVIDTERTALQSYAGQLADASGGSRGLDSPSLYQRGEAIAKPVEELSDYFDAKTKEAYQAADKAAGGVPIDMPATGDFLRNQRSQFLGTVEGKQLREGVQARMRDLGLMDEDGNVQQATVQQAERLKQYLGDQWSPRTSRLIGQLKGAIDDDVTKAAGSDIYANARQTRALRATLLDDPTGIAKLAAPDDRLGINRTVPLEQVPDYMANLPADQFGHIVKTLRDVPAEVQPSAASALNEIRSHFANRVEAAGNSTQGMWNTKGVNEYLNKNQLKMAEVYSPEEMQRFKTLADAGNILKMDRTYPGAAAQTHNLAVRGVLQAGKIAGKLGGIAGLVAGHGVEAGATGHVISSMAERGVNKLADRALLAQVEKRIRKF